MFLAEPPSSWLRRCLTLFFAPLVGVGGYPEDDLKESAPMISARPSAKPGSTACLSSPATHRPKRPALRALPWWCGSGACVELGRSILYPRRGRLIAYRATARMIAGTLIRHQRACEGDRVAEHHRGQARDHAEPDSEYEPLARLAVGWFPALAGVAQSFPSVECRRSARRTRCSAPPILRSQRRGNA